MVYEENIDFQTPQTPKSRNPGAGSRVPRGYIILYGARKSGAWHSDPQNDTFKTQIPGLWGLR